MNELKVFKIRFYNYGMLSQSIVLADSIEEAESLLKKDYKEFGIDIQIEEYEEVEDKGVALTWNEPPRTYLNT